MKLSARIRFVAILYLVIVVTLTDLCFSIPDLRPDKALGSIQPSELRTLLRFSAQSTNFVPNSKLDPNLLQGTKPGVLFCELLKQIANIGQLTTLFHIRSAIRQESLVYTAEWGFAYIFHSQHQFSFKFENRPEVASENLPRSPIRWNTKPNDKCWSINAFFNTRAPTRQGSIVYPLEWV